MGIEIKILSSQGLEDFQDLIKVFEIVFDMKNFIMPKSKYLNNLLDKPGFLVLVAKPDKKVIGGLTVYILHPYYFSKPVAYIYDVGILEEYQRMGIGKQLISWLTKYCEANGFEEAYVEAETKDTNAVNFYRPTVIDSELQATHFTYSFGKNNNYNNQKEED